MLQLADKNGKNLRKGSVVDNQRTSTSYDNDVASGSRNDDNDDDDDDDWDDDGQSPSEITGSHDENYVNTGSNRNRKRKGTKTSKKYVLELFFFQKPLDQHPMLSAVFLCS